MSNHTEAKCVTWFYIRVMPSFIILLHLSWYFRPQNYDNFEVRATPVKPQITSWGCAAISFFCINVFLVIQETLQSMIYSAEVLQMNLFIYLLGSSTDYHYISLQLGGWQQWTKTIIASFELFPLNQIISPYIYKHFQTLGQKCNAVHFRLIFKLILQMYSDRQMTDLYQTCSISVRAL